MAGLAAARGRRGGRPSKLTPELRRRCGDAAGYQGLPVRQRRDPQPLDRPHRVLSSLPEGADPGTPGLIAGKGEGRRLVNSQGPAQYHPVSVAALTG